MLNFLTTEFNLNFLFPFRISQSRFVILQHTSTGTDIISISFQFRRSLTAVSAVSQCRSCKKTGIVVLAQLHNLNHWIVKNSLRKPVCHGLIPARSDLMTSSPSLSPVELQSALS